MHSATLRQRARSAKPHATSASRCGCDARFSHGSSQPGVKLRAAAVTVTACGPRLQSIVELWKMSLNSEFIEFEFLPNSRRSGGLNLSSRNWVTAPPASTCRWWPPLVALAYRGTSSRPSLCVLPTATASVIMACAPSLVYLSVSLSSVQQKLRSLHFTHSVCCVASRYFH